MVLRNPFTYHRTVMFAMCVCVFGFFFVDFIQVCVVPILYNILQQCNGATLFTRYESNGRIALLNCHAETWEKTYRSIYKYQTQTHQE